jgi:hypothetical protein
MSPTQLAGRDGRSAAMWEIVKWCFWAALAFAIHQNAPEFMTARCKNKWGDSGLSFRYTRHVGCMVEVDGTWLPEANVQIRR